MSPGTVDNPTARALARTWRLPILACCLVSALALVLGPLLFKQVADTANSNAKLVCLFGKALNQPIKQRLGESRQDFQQRVALAQEFVDVLRSELDNCDVKVSRVRVSPKDRGALQGAGGAARTPTEELEGVVGNGGGNPSGQPSPPGPGSGGEPPNVHLPSTPLTPPVDVCLPPRRPLCN